jgi:IS1 family transposase
MNKLSIEKKTQVITALVEGNSIRATCRMTDTAKGTVTRLLASVGKACAKYQDKHITGLTSKLIQCDEIWSFCYAKQKNVPENKQGQYGYGDVWTWVALDADTKLSISFLVGLRTVECATHFINDLKDRLTNRIQLTTDGYKVYINAVDNAFGSEIDYAMINKLYGKESEGEKRYSPAICLGTEKQIIQGNPDSKAISTSFVERQNLTMRMSMRRFTRLTNGFSKKIENLEHAVALHFMYYNFARPHKTLANPYPRTPAMAAGISDHIWTVDEIVHLMN